jgi:hypothetical protein
MRSLAEWALALGVLWLAAWLSWPWLRSLAPPSSGTFALVESALPALPTGVPAGAEDVPFLMLDSGLMVRRGMAERELTGQPLLSHLAADMPRSERGVLGDRTVLTFHSGPSRFWVVLDRTEIGRDREVTAIYVK